MKAESRKKKENLRVDSLSTLNKTINIVLNYNLNILKMQRHKNLIEE